MTLARLWCLICLALPASARAASLNYTMYVLGVPSGETAMTIDLASASYAMSLRFQATGLARVVTGAQSDSAARGRLENGWPTPLEYRSAGHFREEDRRVTMTWKDSTPALTDVSPSIESEREPVPPAARPRAIDPLSAWLAQIVTAARSGRCEGSIRAYDGRVLSVWEARTGGEDMLEPTSRSSFSGPALRCEIVGRPIAGFRFGDAGQEDRREKHVTIWLGQVLPGMPRLPVRSTVETRWFGSATLYLTAAAP